MRPVYVCGLGLWAPGHADPAAWCLRKEDPSVEVPEATLLTHALRRRASHLTRMGVEVLQQAISRGGRDSTNTPSVWATAHGEHETALAILGMMQRGEGKLSPTQFHNSVHNTASGYASIAAGNCVASTTLTGGSELVATTFLEGMCLLEAGESDVVLVLADEPLRRPFDQHTPGASLALSFCLSARRHGAIAVLADLRRHHAPPIKRHERFGSLYVSAALPLLERIVLGEPGIVALEFESEDAGPVWCLDLELASAE